MKKLITSYFPLILGIIACIIVDKYFPEKISEITEINPQKDLRGGHIFKKEFFKKVYNSILKNRKLKILIISSFATIAAQNFTEEIIALLTDEELNKLCIKEVDGQLEIVCNIIKNHNLNLHNQAIRELILTKGISNNDKVNLLKIKLDFIINGECMGKTRFMIGIILSLVVAVCFSGVGGLALFLEALFRLFQEGKISEALYKQILKAVLKGKMNVPPEHF